MNSILQKTNQWSEDFEINKKPNLELLHKAIAFLEEELQETKAALESFNSTCDISDYDGIIDGFADIAFVAENGIYKAFRALRYEADTAHKMTEIVQERVCNANDAKRTKSGTVMRDMNGKVQKPDGWTAPSFYDLIDGKL